jgi:AcrR family transcriptional regulator
MGRTKTFNEYQVLEACKTTFITNGYEGTSIDQLVASTGLLRGSLYSAYGSKRGLFIATLHSTFSSQVLDYSVLDLCLVALLELSPDDTEVRSLVGTFLTKVEDNDWSKTLGERLLIRAGVKTK